jgi:hypothetical protein
MSGEHTKPSNSTSSSPHELPPPAPEHIHPNGVIPLPPHPNMYPLPSGPFPPLFFAPHPEGIGSHGDANGTYPLPPYPHMMYLYPPPPPPGPGELAVCYCSTRFTANSFMAPGSPFSHGPASSPPPTAKPKRKQVKMAVSPYAHAELAVPYPCFILVH